MKRKIELCRNFDPAKINTSLDEFRSKIEEFDHWYIGFANMLNESLEDVREGLMKKYGSKRKIRTRSTEKNIASMVFGFLETKYNGTSEILKDPELLSCINLFSYGFDYYYKNLEHIDNWRSKTNHIYDLFNLGYVGFNDYYAAFDWKEPYLTLQKSGKTARYFPIKKLAKRPPI